MVNFLKLRIAYLKKKFDINNGVFNTVEINKIYTMKILLVIKTHSTGFHDFLLY